MDQKFISFRKKWDSCFEVSEDKRREILSKMTEEELNHFLCSNDKVALSRDQKIEEHLEFFAREMCELDEDSEEMDF